MRLFFALAGSACLASCATHRHLLAPLPACEPAAVATESWTTLAGQGFTIRLPPGLRPTVRTGIDGIVREYTGGGLLVAVEAGPNAGGTSTEHPSRTDCEAMIGGKPARVASYLDERRNAYVVHAFWPGIGPRLPLGMSNLSVHVRATRPDLQPSMRAIVRSVRFTER